MGMGIGIGIGLSQVAGNRSSAPNPENAILDDDGNVLTTDEGETLLAGED